MVTVPEPKKRVRYTRRTLGRLALRSLLAIALIAIVSLTVAPERHRTCNLCQATFMSQRDGNDLQERSVQRRVTRIARIRTRGGFGFQPLTGRDLQRAYRCARWSGCACRPDPPVDEWLADLKAAVTPSPPQTAAPNPAAALRNAPRMR